MTNTSSSNIKFVSSFSASSLVKEDKNENGTLCVNKKLCDFVTLQIKLDDNLKATDVIKAISRYSDDGNYTIASDVKTKFIDGFYKLLTICVPHK